jgi:hypothetical protein
MRNAKSLKIKSTNLFCHRDDHAFQLLDRLEELFARMVAAPGSRFLRERLHRASARLAQIVITAADEEHPDEVSARYKPAVVLCRLLDGILKLLRRYAVLASPDHDDALTIVKGLMRSIARRYLGVDVVDSDDDPPAGSAPPDAAQVVISENPEIGIAASGARKRIADA